MRRLFFLISIACLTILPLPSVRPQDNAAPVTRSVVVVLDCSYSMRIIEPSRMRRLDILKRGLRKLFSRPISKTEWALVSFTDSDSVSVDNPFTKNPRSLLAIVNRLEIGRLSPIEKSLELAADYLVREGRGLEKSVLLVSDGISTGSENFQILLSSVYEKHSIRLFILGFNSPNNPVLSDSIVRLARYTGGEFYTFDRLEQLRERLAGQTDRQRVARDPQRVARDPQRVATKRDAVREVSRTSKNPAIAPMIHSGSDLNIPDALPRLSGKAKPKTKPKTPQSLGFVWMLVAGVLLIAVSIYLYCFAKSQEKRNKETSANQRTFLSLSIQRPGQKSETLLLEKSPVTIGNNPACDIRLDIMTGKWRDVFTYNWDEHAAYFNSKREFLLNGVAVKNKELRNGDRLKFGNFSLTFNSLEDEPIQLPVVRNYGHIPLSAGCFLLIFSLLLITIRRAHTIPGPPSDAAVPFSRASQSAALEQMVSDPASDGLIREAGEKAFFTYQASLAERPPLREETRSQHLEVSEEQIAAVEPGPEIRDPEIPGPEIREKGYKPELAPERRQVAPLKRFPIRVIAPSEDIDYFKADILFFHAHPDDESLDFAGLMAKAKRHGKRIVTVVFTDGESGLDQFPNRGIGGSHPAEHLHGEDLAAVRVEEAKAALSLLGSEVYIRLALMNHRYNTAQDYLPVRAVIGEWGGESTLLKKIRKIIEGFRPTLVVSSDFNTEAFEHFEHKAVGSMVDYTLRYLMSRGDTPIRGYLVSVDPFQKRNLYPFLELVDMRERDPVTGLTYREIQFNALKEHRTQGDASLIGVELLPHFRWEQYYPHIWKFNTSLEDYIKSKD